IGLLAETSLGVYQHPSLSQGGRHLSIPRSNLALQLSRVPFVSHRTWTYPYPISPVPISRRKATTPEPSQRATRTSPGTLGCGSTSAELVTRPRSCRTALPDAQRSLVPCSEPGSGVR